MKERTEAFALRIISFVAGPSRGMPLEVMRRQLLRSATSIGANYRSARRARSNRDFWARIKIVDEEADETVYWLRLISKSGLEPGSETSALLQEAGELSAIFSVTAKKARRRFR